MSRLPGESLNKKKVILLCPLLHIDLGSSVHLSQKKLFYFFRVVAIWTFGIENLL